MHIICGYANDIAGVDGGYLVIGVKTENGLPVLPPVGVPDELLDDIQLKIFQYCNKIEPRYIPKIEIVEYQGVNLVYLKCAEGDAGSYQAPVDVYSKKEVGKEQDRTMKTSLKKMSEVLAQKDYNKVSTIVSFMEEHGEITPKEAEAVTGKSAATVRRYFKMLTGTRYIEGSTNNIVYRIVANLP